MQNLAIVLKNYFPYKQKIVVFDREHGKLCQILPNETAYKLCNGTLFSYIKDKNKNYIKDVEILKIPLDLGQYNILFLHHILEVYYYFFPEGISSLEAFNLFCFLYRSNKGFDEKIQKIILYKLFLILGFNQDCYEFEFDKNFFNNLLFIPFDKIGQIEINLNYEKKLDVWLSKCLSMHPDSNLFKTLGIINEINKCKKNN